MSKTDAAKYALPNQMRLATVSRAVFTLTVPPEISLEEVMEPTYLSACFASHKLLVGTRIEVTAGDGWWAEILVVGINHERKNVYTKVLIKPILMVYDPTAGAANYLLEKGPTGRWVARLNKKTIKDFATEAEAKAWVANKQAA